VVERAFILPPHGQIGPIDAAARAAIMQNSLLAGHYEKAVDRESAYEILKARAERAGLEQQAAAEEKASQKAEAGSGRQSVVEAFVKSTVRAIGSQLGREILRGVMGSILGGGRRR
jgi:hypothetical protein